MTSQEARLGQYSHPSWPRLVWLLGSLFSLGTSAMALQVLNVHVLPASGLFHVQAYMVLQGGALICFAHLLWRGLGLRILPVLSLVLGGLMLAMFLFPVNNATSPYLMNLFFGGRAPFGILLLLYVHRIPVLFRVYGVAPLLTAPLYFLFSLNLYPVEATRNAFGGLEVVSAVLMALLFAWSIRQLRHRCESTAENATD
ncbi:MAG: hypothetical protein IT368_04320 [Candidatus Hydrogenedentes bacterium]|nr:hypothetical protein [Candidatus Hydrogenedentota bacterium]